MASHAVLKDQGDKKPPAVTACDRHCDALRRSQPPTLCPVVGESSSPEPFDTYIERVLAVLVAATSGLVFGALLGWAAFQMEPSDEHGDWRAAGLRTRTTVIAAIAGVSALAAAAAWVLSPEPHIGLTVAAFAAASPGLAVVDIATRRLPFAALGLIAVVALAGLASTPYLGASLIAAAVVAAALLVLALVVPGGTGGGDIAAAAVATVTLAWAGIWAPVVALAAAMLLTGIVGLALRAALGRAIPVALGPFLTVGWWLAYIVSIVDL